MKFVGSSHGLGPGGTYMFWPNGNPKGTQVIISTTNSGCKSIGKCNSKHK